MPAAVETAVYANRPAWHGLGNVIEAAEGMTVEVALEQSGLDWEVEKVPCFIAGPDARSRVRVPDRFGVRRTSDGAALGVVGRTWQPVQNREGFAVLQAIIDQAGGEVGIEAAGSLEDGRKVWILARMLENFFIAGEEYKSYLFFTNGHNGRTSVTAGLCDERIVCANTLDIGLREASAAERIIRVRHTVRSSERLQQAAEIFRLRNIRREELALQGEWLVEQTMSDGAFEMFLESLMPIPVEQQGTPADTMITTRREAVAEIYHGANNLQPIRGTKWGALQSVLEYSDHGRRFSNDETKMKAQMGLTSAPLKQRAYDLLALGAPFTVEAL